MIPERFAQAVVNGLAVLGAFLIGSLVIGLVIAAFTRWLGRTAPARFRALRLIGGGALAVLVACILFGRGQGWNLFSGGADSDGDDTGNRAPQHISTPVEKTPTSITDDASDRIVVTILGGTDVVAERFYLLNSDSSPMTLAELQPKLLAVKSGTATLEIRFPAQNVLPVEHPAVVRLDRWARQSAGLRVLLPADGS